MKTVGSETYLPIELRSLSGSGTSRAPKVAGYLEKRQGERFTVHLGAYPETGIAPDRFQTGMLVELTTPERYYLGVVSSSDGASIKITAEHELDRAAVSAIQATWGSPSGGATPHGTIASE